MVSPHLDDAVLSCGRTIAAHPGSTAVTVFAGERDSWDEVSDWDRRCGFAPGVNVTKTRRDEDRRALALLDAVPYWLDELDEQYRTEVIDADRLRLTLTDALHQQAPEVVLAPMGLKHTDHRAVGEACRTVWSAGEDTARWLWYADQPYADLYSGVLHAKLDELSESFGTATAVPMPSGGWLRKLRAIRAYRSQYRALGPWTLVQTARAGESFWEFARPPRGPAS